MSYMQEYEKWLASPALSEQEHAELESIRDDEKEIRERYFALTQKPLIACMKDACNRYLTAIGENCPQKKS